MPITLYIYPDNLKALDREAAMNDESISELVNYILSDYFEGAYNGNY